MSKSAALASLTNSEQTRLTMETRNQDTLSTSAVAALAHRVALSIPPLWPLRDMVAVNPFLGYIDTPIEQTHALMRRRHLANVLPPLHIMKQLYHDAHFSKAHVRQAIAERSAKTDKPLPVNEDDVVALLSGTVDSQPAVNDYESLSFARWLDSQSSIVGNWVNGIVVDIGRFCSTRYDEGVARWRAFEGGPLFAAWKRYATHSRAMHARGLSNFHLFARSLPDDATAALQVMLEQVNVVQKPYLEDYLHSLLGEVPGWAGYLRKRAWDGSHTASGEVVDLLAIRLAYDAALLQCATTASAAKEFLAHLDTVALNRPEPTRADTTDAILLEALEIAYREKLFTKQLASAAPRLAASASTRPSAQVVLCIDVRSEILRRHLLAAAPQVEAYGFAGFFGLPIQVPSESETVQPQCPVLLQPSVTAKPLTEKSLSVTHAAKKWTSSVFKHLSQAAPSCFIYVETIGFLSLFRMLGDVSAANKTGTHEANDASFVITADHTTRVALAKGILKNLGLRAPYARLVLLCGHQSTCSNNPQAAGLQCGACAGHSGAPNASAAAELLNDPKVRESLATEGWSIPSDTLFVPAVHDTASDDVHILDSSPSSHRDDVKVLQEQFAVAGQKTREERSLALGISVKHSGSTELTKQIKRRMSDISEVRPEWALAGNASFITAPATTLANCNLEGRSFLHNYDESLDPDGSVLETILTAPVVVASWINLQYFGSSVAPRHFGSGLKTLHNVSAGVGVICGNDGDLAQGLAAHSVHSGEKLRHLPVRLHVVVQASQERLDAIIAKHRMVADLVDNEWILLFSASDRFSSVHRRMPRGGWAAVEVA